MPSLKIANFDICSVVAILTPLGINLKSFAFQYALDFAARTRLEPEIGTDVLPVGFEAHSWVRRIISLADELDIVLCQHFLQLLAALSCHRFIASGVFRCTLKPNDIRLRHFFGRQIIL